MLDANELESCFFTITVKGSMGGEEDVTAGGLKCG